MYYAVEFSLEKNGRLYVELDYPVSSYHNAIALARMIAEQDNLLEDGDSIRCEREVFETP